MFEGTIYDLILSLNLVIEERGYRGTAEDNFDPTQPFVNERQGALAKYFKRLSSDNRAVETAPHAPTHAQLHAQPELPLTFTRPSTTHAHRRASRPPQGDHLRIPHRRLSGPKDDDEEDEDEDLFIPREKTKDELEYEAEEYREFLAREGRRGHQQAGYGGRESIFC